MVFLKFVLKNKYNTDKTTATMVRSGPFGFVDSIMCGQEKLARQHL
jgi:hypothetical protein